VKKTLSICAVKWAALICTHPPLRCAKASTKVGAKRNQEIGIAEDLLDARSLFLTFVNLAALSDVRLEAVRK
jgi:isopentenyldiphosphate isomerase